MNLLALFKRRPRKIEIVNRDEAKISLSEWRTDPELVKVAMRVWNNPDFRLMVACLRNETPAFLVLPDDASPTRCIAIQRRSEGYTMALANLEAMATFQSPPAEVEATFEPEEKVEL